MTPDEDDLMIDYDYSELSIEDTMNELFAIINNKKFNSEEKH